MTALFASGHVVDIILAIMVLEAGLLLAYRYRTRRGPSAAELLSVLVPGVFLLLALRGALVGAGMVPIDGATLSAFVKSILAGWLIALMVWMLPSARSARLFVVLLLTYVVALGHFPHIVAGSVEAAFVVFTGEAHLTDYLGGFLLPTLIGNTLGGVALAALLNHAPLADELS
jgi:formate/nitrite transporter FocA (FNT family)